MLKRIVLIGLLLMGGIGGILKANDVITSTLPQLSKDKRGYKLSPTVVYNKTTGKYETVYLKVDDNGNQFTVISGTPTMVNSDYDNKKSTYTVGTWNESGSLALSYDVGNVSFKQKGNGVNTINLGFGNGTIDFYINNDNFSWTLPRTESNLTINYTLTPGTSIQFFIGGVN